MQTTDHSRIPQKMRLQKFLAHAGICSRRHAEKAIAKGLVSVNGQKVLKPGLVVDPSTDRVTFEGRRVELKKRHIYIALNKPEGYLCTCSRGRGRIVLDLVEIKERIYPVGRLDKDSKGLILLTNDGRLHHRLLHPSFGHEKEYLVRTYEPISDADLLTMSKGVMIDGRKTAPATIERLSGKRFRIIIKEGRNRQIRKMVKAVGNRVAELERIRISHVLLGDLEPGRWRHLTREELKGFDPLFKG